MALTKEKKQKALRELKEKIAKQKSIVFADFSKVNSKDLFSLRKSLKEAGCLLKVGKKTLLRIAFGQLNFSLWNELKDKAKGQLALILGFEDELKPAKISYDFSKTNENFKILGGFFENEFIAKDRVLALANLPSRNDLLAKLIGSLSSPISGFQNVLQGNIKGLITVLSKIKK